MTVEKNSSISLDEPQMKHSASLSIWLGGCALLVPWVAIATSGFVSLVLGPYNTFGGLIFMGGLATSIFTWLASVQFAKNTMQNRLSPDYPSKRALVVYSITIGIGYWLQLAILWHAVAGQDV